MQSRAAWIASCFLTLFAVACLLLTVPALAQSAAPEPAPQAASPQKVKDLLQLLGDKEIQDWLQAQKQLPAETGKAADEPMPGMVMSHRLKEIQQHLLDLVKAVPAVPSAVGRAASALMQSAEGHGIVSILLLIGSFVLSGFIVQWLFGYLVRGWKASHQQAPVATPRERLTLHARNFAFGMGGVAAFGAGSIGAFVIFQWPELLHAVVLTMLAAALVSMIAWNLLEIVLSPAGPHAARLIPMTDESARHHKLRLALAAGWFAVGYGLVQVMRLLHVETGVIRLIAYTLGLGLLAIGLELVWRRPAMPPEEPVTGAAAIRHARAVPWLYTLWFAALWLSWVAGTLRLFWLLVIGLGLPLAISLLNKLTASVCQVEGGSDKPAAAPTVAAACITRGLRALLILGSIWVLAWSWGIGLHHVAGDANPISKITRSILTVIVLLLVADLVWHLVRTLIDAALEKARAPGDFGTAESIRRAKIRTLLPIIRNVFMVFMATLALLMALSALDVNIAPLIASAGVVGVAIGFGAQALVKDVISGMFYLLDDAFRVGEYIETGRFKGTVESFSLRSVRLRHHRGPVYTIPFGELGAVQNQSRDYVIDKLLITVTYDTDLEKARKLIKKVGEKLMEDPELAPSIIDPLKMQAVEGFGDYGITLKLKMTTRPGEQYALRKKAFPMIKKSFDENGIEIASPTVRVAEGDSSKVVAAKQMLAAQAKNEAGKSGGA